MARIRIIWDQRTVRVWRSKGSNSQLIEEFSASDVSGLLAGLEASKVTSKMTHLKVYVDLPELDHHVERVPKLSPKLRRQLLGQRHLKMYGDEPRVWVAQAMEMETEAGQQFFLISSLPEPISKAFTQWAQKNGVVLEGLYSLPLALARIGGTESQVTEPFIQFLGIGDAGYLIARDAAGKVLFFNRLDNSEPGPEELEAGVRRLVLFVEQEFSLTPELRSEPPVADNDAALVGALGRQKTSPQLSLVLPAEKRRQSFQRIRHRAFALLAVCLLLTLDYTLPRIEKTKELELRSGEVQTEIGRQKAIVRELERGLEAKAAYLDVIDFSQGRETMKENAPVPSPLLVMLHALSNSLPQFLELDSYEGQIDSAQGMAHFTLSGRPLTADLDLSAEIKQLYEVLQKRGWSLDEPEVVFESNSGNSRFASQRGGLRKFTVKLSLQAR